MSSLLAMHLPIRKPLDSVNKIGIVYQYKCFVALGVYIQ